MQAVVFEEFMQPVTRWQLLLNTEPSSLAGIEISLRWDMHILQRTNMRIRAVDFNVYAVALYLETTSFYWVLLWEPTFNLMFSTRRERECSSRLLQGRQVRYRAEAGVSRPLILRGMSGFMMPDMN